MSKEIKTVLTFFLSWRIATILFTIFLINLIQITNTAIIPGESIPLKLWSSWDGGHYIGIALNGYSHPQQYAFFPLYPILIKTLTIIGFNPYFAALLISNIAFAGAVVMLFKLAKLYEIPEKNNYLSILMLITVPTAFFFSAAYTESLLLFFSTTGLFFAKKQQWFWASLFAGLATFTKIIGIGLVILLIFEYFSQQKDLIKYYKTITIKKLEPLFYLLTFGLSGLYLYMYYLYSTTGNALLFSTIQTHWGRSATISNPIDVLSDGVSSFVIPDGVFSLTIQSLEVLIIIIVLILIPFIIKRFGYMLGLYTLFLTVFTLLSGKTDSSLRYILTAFPLFWLFGTWAAKSDFFYYTYMITGILLQGLFLTLFLMGHWVG